MGRAVIWTGRVHLDLECPDPGDIHLEDIARGLSRAPRFAGLTEVPLSVAEHCLLCEELARGFKMPLVARLAMLMHDAAEAYICDLPAPLRQLLPGHVRIEERLLDAIWQRFDLPRANGAPLFDPLIDHLALDIERRACFPSSLGRGAFWPDPPDPPGWAPTTVGGRNPEMVRQRFMFTAGMLMSCADDPRALIERGARRK